MMKPADAAVGKASRRREVDIPELPPFTEADVNQVFTKFIGDRGGTVQKFQPAGIRPTTTINFSPPSSGSLAVQQISSVEEYNTGTYILTYSLTYSLTHSLTHSQL